MPLNHLDLAARPEISKELLHSLHASSLDRLLRVSPDILVSASTWYGVDRYRPGLVEGPDSSRKRGLFS